MHYNVVRGAVVSVGVSLKILPIIPCLQSQYCSRRQRKGGGGGHSWCLQGAGEVILLLYIQYSIITALLCILLIPGPFYGPLFSEGLLLYVMGIICVTKVMAAKSPNH